jgi:hypothetical protein
MLSRRGLMIFGSGAALAGLGAWYATRWPSYDEAVQATWTMPPPPAEPDLDYLVHYAVLAANSHNTQPWLFSRAGTTIEIRPDLKRATPVVDPDNHHLFASLGCAAENLMLAAGAAGKGSGLAFAGDGDGALRIDLAGTASAPDPLFAAIVERQCTRSEYDGSAVGTEELEAMKAAAQVEGCEIILIPDKPKIEQALELVTAANGLQVADKAFTAELKSWLRFNPSQAIATRDGLYGGCSGNPNMPGPLGSLMFDVVFKPQAENDRIAKQIRSSAGLAVFVADRNDASGWVAAGRGYQRFALKATALGLRHAFINQPVEVASMRSEFASWLGIGERRPDLVVRYGRAPAMPRSLRRPVADVIVST